MDRRFLLWIILACIAGALTGLVDSLVGLNYGLEILITAAVVGLLLFLWRRFPGPKDAEHGLGSVTAQK